MTTMHNRQRYKSERHHALDNDAPTRVRIRFPAATLGDDEIESLYNETPEPTREPMFAASPLASRVVGVVLAISAAAVACAVFWP